MAKQRDLTKRNFDELLLWLNPDRQQAALKYQELHNNLVKIFTWRGCNDAEGLADETFDRVAAKVVEIRQTFVGDPSAYFYSIARLIVKEEHRRATHYVQWADDDKFDVSVRDTGDTYTLEEYDCFDRCFQELDRADQMNMSSYYLKQGQAKIEHHREMAEHMGISTGTLRVRMYRIREKLMKCIADCLEASSQ